jgi:site-specific DNA-methyltransferase (adenine-specific)
MTPYYADDLVTIYHGDCREWTAAWQLAAVMVTDPPYGIEFSSGMGGKFLDTSMASDGDTSVRDRALVRWGSRPALVFGTWKAPRPKATRHVLIWEKGDHVGMGDLSIPWRPNTEEIYVLGTGFVGHRGTSVLRHNAPSPNFTPPQFRYHPTEKPLALMRDLIGKCPLGTILDPFMGSGTTLVAAKSLGRHAVGIEIEERYCEIAAQRCRQEVLGLVG